MTQQGRVALVVDDQVPARRLARVVFEEAGWEVVEAASAAEALEVAATRRPAVVVLDHAMPGMTGMAVVGLLRQRAPGVYVALWSADDRARLSGDDADAYLDKVDLSALEALARRWPARAAGP